LILDDDAIKELKENGIPPEQEIVVKYLMYFGPLPNGAIETRQRRHMNYSVPSCLKDRGDRGGGRSGLQVRALVSA
jgi:hypothetical protein